MTAIGCRSLILRAGLFRSWVLESSVGPNIFLLILMTTSWSLITAKIAFKCFIRLAITSNPLELGSLSTLLVFAWIVREGLLSAKVAKAKESRSFRHLPHETSGVPKDVDLNQVILKKVSFSSRSSIKGCRRSRDRNISLHLRNTFFLLLLFFSLSFFSSFSFLSFLFLSFFSSYFLQNGRHPLEGSPCEQSPCCLVQTSLSFLCPCFLSVSLSLIHSSLCSAASSTTATTRRLTFSGKVSVQLWCLRCRASCFGDPHPQHRLFLWCSSCWPSSLARGTQ